MRAFERVSRAIQRLCNGYASLPGLLEWGRTNAARMQAERPLATDSDTLHNTHHASSFAIDRNDGREVKPFLPSRRGVTAAPRSRREPRTTKAIGDSCAPKAEGKGLTAALSMSFPFKTVSTFCSPRYSGYGGVEGFDVAAAYTQPVPRKSPSTASIPSWRHSPVPESNNNTSMSYDLPKMMWKGSRVEDGDTKALRRRLQTAGNCTVRRVSGRAAASIRGVLCDGDYGQPATGSAWSGSGIEAPTGNRTDDMASLGGSVDSTSNSTSVSSLLREAMIFRRKNDGDLHG